MNAAESTLPTNRSALPPVLWWLQLEGLAVAVLSLILFTRTDASWWLFATLWLVPDLSTIGYWAGPRVGANCYNTVHSYLLPIALMVALLLLHRTMLQALALIWFNHIGVDRLLGYGLKYSSGFGITHLKRLGRRPGSSAS